MAELIIHALIKQPGTRAEQDKRHRHGLREQRTAEREEKKKLTDRGSLKESEPGAAGGGSSEHVAVGFSVYGDS